MESRDEQNQETQEEINPQSLRSYLSFTRRGGSFEQAAAFIIMINILLYFIRPQSIGPLGFIGTVRIPLLIVILGTLAWLPRAGRCWRVPSVLMMGMLIFEALRGFAGFLAPNDWIVRNDGQHYNGWEDLAMLFLSMAFPMVVYFSNKRQLIKIFGICIIVGAFLGAYAITHAGKGPGGHLEDENDLCLVLNMFLPFALFSFFYSKSMVSRLPTAGSALLLFGGIVITKSRGGFLGLLAVLFYLFLKSRKKLLISVAGIVFIVSAIPFIPTYYYDEIRTIPRDLMSDEGTIKERLDTWSIIFDMWKDPKNILLGVGLKNTPWNLHLYEPAERGYTIKSLGGRAAHSLYFQILGDLGLYGVLLILTIFYKTIVKNNLLLREITERERQYTDLSERLRLIAQQTGFDEIRNRQHAPPEYDNVEAGFEIINESQKDMQFLDTLMRATNVSWAGTLAAATGISVFYYPSIWFLVGLSLAMQVYWERLRTLFDESYTFVTSNAEFILKNYGSEENEQ